MESMSPRVLVLENGTWQDVFDVLELTDYLVRARSPFLFEIGEELTVRIQRDDSAGETETTARVRGHAGPDDNRVTELELATARAKAKAGER